MCFFFFLWVGFVIILYLKTILIHIFLRQTSGNIFNAEKLMSSKICAFDLNTPSPGKRKRWKSGVYKTPGYAERTKRKQNDATFKFNTFCFSLKKNIQHSFTAVTKNVQLKILLCVWQLSASFVYISTSGFCNIIPNNKVIPLIGEFFD